MQRLLRITAACALTLAVAGPAFAADDLRAKAKEVFEVIPTSVPEIKGNAITPARIELGRKLFFDPRLSRSGLISCNTCHNLGMGGDDNLETSIGHGWQRDRATRRPF